MKGPMTRAPQRLLAALCLVAAGLAPHAFAAPPAAAADAAPAPGSFPVMVVGNPVWQPGLAYTAGDDWLALACDPAGCAFEPARLAVKPEGWQGHDDDKPTNGQTLTFARMEKTVRKPVAWFQRRAGTPWLKPGPVTTWASIAGGFQRADSPGTLELEVAAPDGTRARFVPLLDIEHKRFVLQLRSGQRRQMLQDLAACSHEVGTGYLLWAGDLDGDGRGDYLASFVDADGQVVLYLSRLAPPNALVGAGAIYDASPYGGECDGTGWLEGL
jgi:hypothetical protein